MHMVESYEKAVKILHTSIHNLANRRVKIVKTLTRVATRFAIAPQEDISGNLGTVSFVIFLGNGNGFFPQMKRKLLLAWNRIVFVSHFVEGSKFFEAWNVFVVLVSAFLLGAQAIRKDVHFQKIKLG